MPAAWASAPPIAAPGRDRLVRGLRRQARGDDCGHAGLQREPQIDLGQTRVAAIRAHHALVVRERQHQPACERVAVDRRDGRARERQHAREEGVDPTQIGTDRVRSLAGECIEREPVRVELALTRGDERGRPGVALDFVERHVQVAQQLRREAVLAVAHLEDEDVAVASEVDHAGAHAQGAEPGSFSSRRATTMRCTSSGPS